LLPLAANRSEQLAIPAANGPCCKPETEFRNGIVEFWAVRIPLKNRTWQPGHDESMLPRQALKNHRF